MVIYQILNRLNGKSYVGQAKNGFFRRYQSRNWWRHVQNSHLKAAIEKYGHEHFEVIRLETNVESEADLDQLEREHIKRLDCVHPNGYNYQAGGQARRNRGHHRETCDRMAVCRSGGKVYRLLNNKTGVVHEFVNMQRFADANGLSGPMLSVMLSGKLSSKSSDPYYSQHKGWSLPERPIRRILCTGPDGSEEVILDGVDGGIKGFCKRHSMRCSANVIATINGEFSQAYGWRFKILT